MLLVCNFVVAGVCVSVGMCVCIYKHDSLKPHVTPAYYI